MSTYCYIQGSQEMRIAKLVAQLNVETNFDVVLVPEEESDISFNLTNVCILENDLDENDSDENLIDQMKTKIYRFRNNIGLCCFCNQECNGASQCCGTCARQLW